MQGYANNIRKHYEEMGQTDPNTKYEFINIMKPDGSGGELTGQLESFNAELGRLPENAEIAAIIHGGAPPPRNTNWEQELEELINRYNQHSSNISFIGSPPPRADYSDPKWNARSDINSGMRSYLEELGIPYHDVFEDLDVVLSDDEHWPQGDHDHPKVHLTRSGYEAIYKSLVRDHITLDSVPSRQIRVTPSDAPETDSSQILSRDPEGQYPSRSYQYDNYFREAANQSGITAPITPELIKALAMGESRFRPNAVNRKSGASGMMQFIPMTARGRNARLQGVGQGRSQDQRFQPQYAIPAAARLLNWTADYILTDRRDRLTSALHQRKLRDPSASDTLEDKYLLMLTILGYRDGQNRTMTSRKYNYQEFLPEGRFEEMFNSVMDPRHPDRYLRGILKRSGIANQ